MASRTASDPFSMSPGGAIRVSHPHEVGPPRPVLVRAEVARRSRYLRVDYLTLYWDDEAADEYLCAVFQDPKTGEVYGQPVTERA